MMLINLVWWLFIVMAVAIVFFGSERPKKEDGKEDWPVTLFWLGVVAIPLAAGAFAWAGITLSPAVGAILMSVSTIVVALNAQLLRRVSLKH